MHDRKKRERDTPAGTLTREIGFESLDPSLAVRATRLDITLRQHLTGIDQLNDVDILLERHHRGRNDSDDPGYLAVNLVRARHLQSAGTPGAGKETARRRVGRVTGLGGGWLRIGDRLQESGRQNRRGEREEVDADEK